MTILPSNLSPELRPLSVLRIKTAQQPNVGVEELRKKPILMVGNFLSSSVMTRGVCEELAARLSAAGWPVLTTSNKRHRVTRLADMIDTVWRRRRDYEVAHVDVFSGPAFSWAEAVCWSLKQINKPYIL